MRRASGKAHVIHEGVVVTKLFPPRPPTWGCLDTSLVYHPFNTMQGDFDKLVAQYVNDLPFLADLSSNMGPVAMSCEVFEIL
jgi:hypothetical protein